MKRRLALALACLAVIVLTAVAVLWGVTVRDVERRLPSIQAEAARYEREGISLESVPPRWIEILLKVEDPGFYEHSGVDLHTPGAGLTTISQALAKDYCFERFRPGLWNKIRQTIAARSLDRGLGKKAQLVLLLNTASFGPGRAGWVNGFPDAAREYFDKPFSELTERELISLVAMLVGPAQYHPVQNPRALEDRVRRIERLLRGECAPAGVRDVLYRDCG